MLHLDRRLVAQFDWALLGLVLLIPILGLVVQYSGSYDPDTNYSPLSWLPLAIHSPTFMRQVMYLALGMTALLIALCLPMQILHKYAYPLYMAGLLALVGLIVFGQVFQGSRRWYALGFLNFQPSEMVKVLVILALARYVAKNPPPPGGYRFTQLFPPFAIFLVPALLIVRQPDLGTALVVAAVGLAMVLFAGIRWRPLLLMVSSFLAAIPVFWLLLQPYQKRRVLALFNPEADALHSGYHIIQSKIAVGSGGFWGKGFLQGTQTHLEYLPEHTTDFAFSVLAEEWGFVGAVTLLVLYLFLMIRIFRAAARAKELFPALVIFGVGFLFFFHVTVNIGMVVGLLPVVGLPLPLFSYGGSSILTMMTAIGLVLGAAMRRLYFVTR